VNENGQGFSLSYPSISLHAVAKDITAYPKPCLYIMFDGKLGGKHHKLTVFLVITLDKVIAQLMFVIHNSKSLLLI
jgi:Regulator of volume decrease after cellular swelling